MNNYANSTFLRWGSFAIPSFGNDSILFLTCFVKRFGLSCFNSFFPKFASFLSSRDRKLFWSSVFPDLSFPRRVLPIWSFETYFYCGNVEYFLFCFLNSLYSVFRNRLDRELLLAAVLSFNFRYPGAALGSPSSCPLWSGAAVGGTPSNVKSQDRIYSSHFPAVPSPLFFVGFSMTSLSVYPVSIFQTSISDSIWKTVLSPFPDFTYSDLGIIMEIRMTTVVCALVKNQFFDLSMMGSIRLIATACLCCLKEFFE